MEKEIVSSIVSDNLPDFVKEDYQLFHKFAEYYYKFLDQQANGTLPGPSNALRNSLLYQDIDYTIDEFVKNIKDEYAINIPENLLADKPTLYKNIKDYYLTRGSQKSFEFIFSLLSGEAVQISYPSENILRASDGKWVLDKTIKVTRDSGNIFDLKSTLITGMTSGAQAIVENVLLFVPDYPTVVGTAWGVSTATYDQSFSVATQDTSPQDLFFKPDGTKMYVIGNTNDSIYEYNLSTAWDISTANYIQLKSVSPQEISPGGIFFSPDGTKMYIIGVNDDEVNEYTLSTAWDISTASFVQVFSVAAQELSSNGLFFKQTGTKMYVIGNFGDSIYEYDLSTAWNVSTASFVQSFSVAGQEDDPRGIFFKPDGTKMYVIGVSGDDVNEYNLSTAWDISTASYFQAFSVSGQETVPSGIFFKPDGTKMYVIGDTGNDVNEYTLSTTTFEPITYELFLNNQTLTGTFIDGESIKDTNENAIGIVTSTLTTYPGYYRNVDGQLSENIKLQDSKFYQAYSYVIKTGQSIETWRDIVKQNIHPAGLSLFGEVSVQEFIDFQIDDTQLGSTILIGAGGVNWANNSAATVSWLNNYNNQVLWVTG